MQFKKLFSPIKVGTHTYKNRIVAAPIYCGPFINIPGLSDVLINAMTARAKGGAAQVTIGETAVNFCGASREPFPPIDYTDYDASAFMQFKGLTDIIHENDAVAMIELSHCGNSVEPSTGITEAFGPMSFVREDGLVVVAMDGPAMQKTTDEFIAASKYMREAGFDGVMIHAGHGWLLHQFLSPRSNQREDEYGGSLDNRVRFPLSLLRQVREAMGEEFIIEIRVSGDECADNGMGLDETVQFCQMAEPYVDLIHVSVGDYRNPILSGQFSSLFQPHGLNADMSAAVKEAVSIPVTVVGGINEPSFADELITSGKCDMVAMARQLTADADFPNKAKNGMEADINPCLRCYKCFPDSLEGVIDDLTSLFGCTVNPNEFFYDTEFLEKQPAALRNVLVIGGGIGGMQAAISAADRGHQVTLVEKSDRLGGLLNFTDYDHYKKDLWEYKELLIRRVVKRSIKVVFNKTVASADIKNYGADAIIIAIGSEPITPKIDGMENALRAIDVYGKEQELGENVVMIGGGLVGCEAGLHLTQLGHKVDVIEMQDAICPDAYLMHRIALVNEMDKRLSYHTGLRCTKISADGVTTKNPEGDTHTFPADSVVYALGMAAHTADADALREACGDVQVFVIGDCVAPAKVYDACRQAFIAAYSIL